MNAGAPADDGRWRGVRRLLAVRLDNMGDVLMTSPALAAVRESLPGVHLALLCSPPGALAAAHLPMVDAVLAFDAPWVQRPAAADDGAATGQAEAALVDRLAAARFDAAVIFTVCSQSPLPAALLCRLAGIPLRLAHCRENPYALLTDWLPEADRVATGMRHEVRRQLELVAAVGMRTSDERLRFAVLPADRARVAARLAGAGIPAGRRYAVLHPGATAASRRWPAERFGAVAQAIAAHGGAAAVFSGDGHDLALVAQARRAMTLPAVSLAGELGLGELAALLEGAAVLVANNSGPAHLAAAVGTPVVSLYALTNPQHTPWQVPAHVLSHDVPCRWCLKSTCPQGHHECLRGVEPQQAAAAAIDLMRLAHRQPSSVELHT